MKTTVPKLNIDEILEKAASGVKLNKMEIIFLLDQTEEENTEKIFSEAREARSSYFGNKVFFVWLCLFYNLLS